MIIFSFISGGLDLVNDQIYLVQNLSYVNFINVKLPYNVMIVMDQLKYFSITNVGVFLADYFSVTSIIGINEQLKVKAN